jgi:hypothetical protein
MAPFLPFIGQALAAVGITEAAGIAFTTLRKVLAESAKKAMSAGALTEAAAVKEAMRLRAADIEVVRKIMAGGKPQKLPNATARVKDRLAGNDPIKEPSVAKPAAAETAAPAAAVEGEAVAAETASTTPAASRKKKKKTTSDTKKGSFLGNTAKFVGGTAAAGIIFDMVGRAMHPQESGLMGGGEAAGSPDEEALMQLQAMMSRGGGMGGMGGNTGFEPGGELRDMYNKSRGAVSVLNTREGTRAGPPMNSVGVGLDVLTQGYEDMLDRIAHKEPLTLTEAYARHGIVVPNQNMA